MKTVYLVSCVAKKALAAMPSEELYQSDWFRKARQYVDGALQAGDQWFILSAEHHLVEPNRILCPYEKTLLRMKKDERRAWATNVLEQLRQVLDNNDEIVILAGQRYREFLEPALLADGRRVTVPLRGLGIGEQKRWLKRMNAGTEDRL